MLLTACSSPPAGPPVVSVEKSAFIQPVRPAPVKITRIHWGLCGTMACVSIADEKASLQNDVRLAHWMIKMNGIVTYYEKVTAPSEATVPSK